jgi:hypothetical protein
MDSQLEAGMPEDMKHIAEAHKDERREHHEMYSGLLGPGSFLNGWESEACPHCDQYLQNLESE